MPAVTQCGTPTFSSKGDDFKLMVDQAPHDFCRRQSFSKTNENFGFHIVLVGNAQATPRNHTSGPSPLKTGCYNGRPRRIAGLPLFLCGGLHVIHSAP